MSDHAPSIRLTRLYEKTSAKGNVYLVGRIGGAKIAILKSREAAEDGSPMWDVLLSEAPAKRDGKQKAAPNTDTASAGGETERREYARPSGLNHEIPF